MYSLFYEQEACASMSKVYGDMAKEMCDYHFNYGTALLEVARLEENVLGNALSGGKKFLSFPFRWKTMEINYPYLHGCPLSKSILEYGLLNTWFGGS